MLKHIHSETNGRKTAKVLRRKRNILSFGRYVVRLFIDDIAHHGADQFTYDLQDAIEAAAAMVCTQDNRPVSIPFNMAVQHIAGRVMPKGFDISAEAPYTFDARQAHYDKTGRVMVRPAINGPNIFADPEIDSAFRAWNATKYIVAQLPYNAAGKNAALEMQQADIRALYGSGATADYFCELVSLGNTPLPPGWRPGGVLVADRARDLPGDLPG